MPKASDREELLELLGERRLRDAAPSDAEQLDLAVQRRILALAERAHDVVRRGEVLVAVQLPTGERDQVRRVQPRVLGVDGDEHLHDVVFGQSIEDDRRHREHFIAEMFDARVQREQPVLPVNGAEDAFPLGDLENCQATARPAPARI